MSQYALDLGLLQEQIASPSRHERCAGQKQLSDDSRIAIGSVETDERHFWWKREVLHISGDGSQRRSQFTAIVAIALARIRPDPLPRVHLCALWCARAPQRACVLSSQEHRRHPRRRLAAGKGGSQGALPCGLARRIDVKDQIAAPLSIEDAANGFRGPTFAEGMLLEKRAERF